MNNNTIAKFVAIKILVLSVVVGMAVVYFFYRNIDSTLTENITENLQSIGQMRAEQVKLFLDGKKNRVVDFSSDGFIKDSLYDIKHDRDKGETMKRLSRHLLMNKLPVDSSFYKVLALGINGVVVASTDNESVGSDLAADPVYLEGRSRSYVKSLSYDTVSGVKSLVLSAPVIRENEFVGVIVIKMIPDVLMNMMLERTGLGERSETYIINRDGYLVTPSRALEGENKGILTQMISSENSRDCLEDIDKFVIEGETQEYKDALITFLNYRGEPVIGTHNIVPGINWCMLTEVDKATVWEGRKRGFLIAALLVVVGAGLGALTGFFVARKKHFE